MSWILGGIYCGVIWLVFAKLKLLRLSLPIAILLASVGPGLILALLFCAQYLHPFTQKAIVIQEIDPIAAQLTQPGRITKVAATPNVPLKRGDVLFEVDKLPYANMVKRREAELEQVKQGVELAKSSVVLAEANLDRAKADVDYAESDLKRNKELREQNANSKNDLEISITRYEQAKAALAQAAETVQQASLSVDSSIAKVSQAESDLVDAQYDLQQTTVLAPADGFITNLQAREGMLVSAGTGPIMTFVRDSSASKDGTIVATFSEKNFLRIKSGQYSEVAINEYPGQIFTGRVLNRIDVSGAGQLAAGGVLPSRLVSGDETRFAVRIQLDDKDLQLPGGSQGMAAVYTENLQIAGIPVMFLIRAKSWLRYLM
jgi:membrane fusion protein (multidrug efflux system)